MSSSNAASRKDRRTDRQREQGASRAVKQSSQGASAQPQPVKTNAKCRSPEVVRILILECLAKESGSVERQQLSMSVGQQRQSAPSSSASSSTPSSPSLTQGGHAPSAEKKKQSGPTRERNPSLVEKAKARFGRKPRGAERLPDDEADFEEQKENESEQENRKEEYERLHLSDRTKLGMSGSRGWMSA